MTDSTNSTTPTDFATMTIEDMLDAIEAAVKERGEDYVYPKGDPNFQPVYYDMEGHPIGLSAEESGCVYLTRDDKPACIIGLVVSNLDRADILPPASDFQRNAYGLLAENGANAGVAAVAVAAQQAQDWGKTWGEALAEARRTAKTAEDQPWAK